MAEAVKRAKARMGAGWAIIGEDIRSALVAQQVLAIIASNDRDEEPLVKLATLGGRYTTKE